MEENHDRLRQFQHHGQPFGVGSAFLPIAEGVRKISGQHLDSTEDLEIVLLATAQVKDLMVNDQIKQALMAAPLWRYFSEQGLL